MITSNSNPSTLRNILFANAIFSGACGLGIAAASGAVSTFLGLEAAAPFLLALGAGLIGYAALLYAMAARPVISPQVVLFTILADSLWVAGSILLLLGNWLPFSLEGKWAVGIIAVIVDGFAMLQFMEWRKM